MLAKSTSQPARLIVFERLARFWLGVKNHTLRGLSLVFLVITTNAAFAEATYTLQLLDANNTVRANNQFLRSEQRLYASLNAHNLQQIVNVTFQWYQPSGGKYSKYSSYLYPGSHRKFVYGPNIKGTDMSIVLGQWSVKALVKTISGETVYQETIDFSVDKTPNDPPGQYNLDTAVLSKYKPFGTEEDLFTITDRAVYAGFMMDYYYLGSKVGFKLNWYYDEESVFYIMGMPYYIPSPVVVSKTWSHHGYRDMTVVGLTKDFRLPGDISPYGFWLKGQWHVDIFINLDDGEDWQLMKTLPFTIDNEPPIVEITQPAEGFRTEETILTNLTGTAEDNIEVKEVTWRRKNDNGYKTGKANGTEAWNINAVPLRVGENVITVTARDAAKNEGIETVTVFFDNSPPEISIISGLPIGVIGKPYLLGLSAFDKNSNLRDITVNWGDGFSETIPTSGSEASVTLTHSYENEGVFAWTAVVTDEEDETGTAIQVVAIGENEKIAKKMLNCIGLAYDPIDLSTGAQLLQHTLLTTQGVLPLSFELGYYSLLLKEGTAGRGWEDKQFGAFLEELDNGDVKLHWTTNTFNIFPKDGNGGYQPLEVKCYFDRLVKNPEGSFTLTRKNGRVYQFNAQGRLEQIGNTQGQFVDLTYEGDGRLFQVTEPISGVFLEYAYNASGLLESVTDTLGRQASLEYDDNKNLIKLTDAASQTTTYTYNKRGQTLTGTNASGLLLFSNTYDVKRRIIAQEDGVKSHQPAKFVYTNDPTTGNIRTTTVTNRLGKTRIYTFDDNFQVISIEDELGNTTSYPYNDKGQRTSFTDGNGNTTAYTYDNNGNVKTITDALGNQTQLVYDGDNNLLSVTNALGKQIQFVYDDLNRLTRIIDPLNNITRYTYNADGQVLTKTRPRGGVMAYVYEKGLPVRVNQTEGAVSRLGYDAAGRLITVTDVDDNTTTLTYDGIDRLTAVTNTLGHTVSMTYDSRNNLLTFTDANGNVTRRNYDASGNLISQINALGDETHYKYDGEGRLTRVTDAFGRITKLVYDRKGRLTRIINPLGHSQKLSYDAASNLKKRFDAFGKVVMSFDYDVLNNVTFVTDVLSNSSTFEYDKLSRLIRTTDPLDRKTQFNYDDLNRLVSSVDALTGESSQGFDADGNKGSLTDPNDNETQFDFDLSGRLVQETLATSDKVKYTYNARDLLESVTNGRNQQRQFEYDAAGRLSRWTDPDGSVSYTYDNNGNVLTVTDANGTITREYDKLNRVTKYTDTRGNTLQYAYDNVGNLVTLTYPDGKQVHYEYDAADQLITVTDWAQRVTSYDYDKNGRLKTVIRPNETKMLRVFDTAGQLLQQKEIVIETGEVISQFDFEYDAAGNIIKEKATSEADIDINLEMTYAVANRLATYDGSAVQLDADGNMTSGPLSGDMVDFIFDSRNRLTNAGETVYHYDAENQRIGVNQTQYVINSQFVLSQVLVKTEADGTETYYVYGLGLIGQEQGGEYLTYHFDFRGSTVALTDESGQVTSIFQYSPYGLLLSGDASITPFLFNGMYGVMTDSSGLYYMRARFYSPDIRRFVNQDVLLGNIGDGQSLNRYAYVTGRPVSFVDPFGLEEIEPEKLNPTKQQIIGLLDKIKGLDLALDDISGGCEARAYLISKLITDAGYQAYQVWLIANRKGLTIKGKDYNWDFHTANMVKLPDGTRWVIDLAISPVPISVETWKSKFSGIQHSSESEFGTPPMICEGAKPGCRYRRLDGSYVPFKPDSDFPSMDKKAHDTIQCKKAFLGGIFMKKCWQ